MISSKHPLRDLAAVFLVASVFGGARAVESPVAAASALSSTAKPGKSESNAPGGAACASPKGNKPGSLRSKQQFLLIRRDGDFMLYTWAPERRVGPMPRGSTLASTLTDIERLELQAVAQWAGAYGEAPGPVIVPPPNELSELMKPVVARYPEIWDELDIAQWAGATQTRRARCRLRRRVSCRLLRSMT